MADLGSTKVFGDLTVAGDIRIGDASVIDTINAGDATAVKLTGDQTIAGVKTFSSTITGNISGNAGTATTLQTARTINGVAFDGSANITVSDSTAVKLTGNQTIAGVKTFSSNIITKPSSVVANVTSLGTGTTSPIYTPEINVGSTFGYIPWMSTSVMSSSGYRTHNSIGTYRPGATWADSGIYLATGGSDSSPTEAYLFKNGRTISNTAGNISLIGNASTATTLATARTIGMTGDVTWTSGSFNGSADVTGTSVLADSGVTAGTYKAVTVDSKGRVTAGTNPTTLAGYAITDAQTASRTTATFTTVANTWYRIATSAVDIGRNSAEFVVDWTSSAHHGSARFAAGCHYGEAAGVSLMQTNYSKYGTSGITEARIVYHTTFTGNYAYVEVKFAGAVTNVGVNVEMQGTIGWSLVSPSTAGSVPAGYTSYLHTFVTSAAITAGTYPKVTINQEGRVTSGTTLADADIPVLDASKITTGTLPIVRGGTGVTTSTGTGNNVLSTSPTLATPNIGVATGTSFNSITGLATVAPLVAGTATVGTSTLTARQDHIHPVQTSVTGNAGTATKLTTARTINGVAFDGSANITISDSTKVALTGNETIAGIKTFSSSPIVPTPTTDTQATNKQYVDGKYSGFKNYIINGNFDIWQRGTSQTNSSYGSDDRWVNMNVGSTKTHTQVACTDTERALFNASYFSRTVVQSVAGALNYVQKVQLIEDITRLAGKTVTLSFWAKADTAKNIGFRVGYVYGSGGTPSNGVDTGVQLIGLTPTWQKKSIVLPITSLVGKTLGTGGVHTSSLVLIFVFDEGSSVNFTGLGQQSGTFDIAQVQLEEGSVATPFENRPGGLELSLCQRYYEIVMLSVNGMVHSANGDYRGRRDSFKVPKRITPSITLSTTSIIGFGLGASGAAVNIIGGIGAIVADTTGVRISTISNHANLSGAVGGGDFMYSCSDAALAYCSAEL